MVTLFLCYLRLVDFTTASYIEEGYCEVIKTTFYSNKSQLNGETNVQTGKEVFISKIKNQELPGLPYTNESTMGKDNRLNFKSTE